LKKIFLIVFILLLIPNIVWAQNTVEPSDESIITQYYKAEVIKVMKEELNKESDEEMLVGYQEFRVEILTGPFKGKTITLKNTTSGNLAYGYWVSKGDRLLLNFQILKDKILSVDVEDYQRDECVFYLIALFVILLLVIGQRQGIKSVITLVITIVIIAEFMLPLFLEGYDPVELALVTGILVTILTFLIIGGISRKTISAILGTSGGLIAASQIAMFFGKWANLRGLSEEEAQMLMCIPQGVNLDFKGLLFAGIIIGALGAVMDVSRAIACSMEEINYVGRGMSIISLIRSGMNVGRDIMGTMSNTLILAYTGASMNFVYGL